MAYRSTELFDHSKIKTVLKDFICKKKISAVLSFEGMHIIEKKFNEYTCVRTIDKCNFLYLAFPHFLYNHKMCKIFDPYI